MHMLKKEMMTVLVVQHLDLYLEGIKGGRGSATLVRYEMGSMMALLKACYLDR